MAEDRKPLPPYMPYRTFLTFLDHLRAIGVPSHIDKSVMTNLSGAMQTWLRAGLRYMRLVDSDDVPDPKLIKLVKAQGNERKPLLAEVFKSSYSFLNGNIDLKNTTPQKLRAAIAELGAQGETVEKIMTFMIAMAKDADVPVSTLLTKRAITRRPRQKSTQRNGGDVPWHGERSPKDVDVSESAMKTIELPKSGGTLTLSGNINLFSLVSDERELVFKLIDAMNEFASKVGGDDA
jgi:hypothetical protein